MSEDCHPSPDETAYEPLPEPPNKKTFLVLELTEEGVTGLRVFLPYWADAVPELMLSLNAADNNPPKLIANGVSRLEAIGLCAEALNPEIIARVIKKSKNTEEASMRIRDLIMGMERLFLLL